MTIIVDDGYERLFASANSSLNPPPSPDWVDVAVSHYMHAFVVKSRDGIGGIYESMPLIYAQSSHPPCIRPALQAVATINLARVKCMTGERWYRARRLYGDALHGLRLTLGNAGEAHSKTTLLTTVLLSEFDVRLCRVNGWMLNPIYADLFTNFSRLHRSCRERPPPPFQAHITREKWLFYISGLHVV